MEHLLDLFGSEDSSCPKGERRKPSLPPEVEEGNVEYKLKLLNPSTSRFEHLVTQMNWRLKEGSGEAIYEIGVSDDGLLCGLSQDDLDSSLHTLNKMADRLGASVSVLHHKCVQREPTERCVAEVLVRKVPENQQFIDIKVAVLGNVEAGKSTLLGVLTQGELDNGRGKARLNLFRHLHEIQSGRTSSISQEILGFDSKGDAVDYSQCQSAEDICEVSSKVITFIDLAGHQKYLRTTVFGLTAHCPEFVMLVVAGNTGVAETTRLHYSYSSTLGLRTFFVVTKADACDMEDVQKTVSNLRDMIIANRGVPLEVGREQHVTKAAESFAQNKAVPILIVSSVTGYNLDLVKKFLNTLPPLLSKKEVDKREQEHPEFQVDEVYSVSNAGGVVVGGVLTKGVLREGDTVQVSSVECSHGGGLLTTVISVQRYRVPCRVVKAGQYATLALKDIDRTLLRKGTVLLSPQVAAQTELGCSCYEFEACVTSGDGLRVNGQVTLYIGAAVQNAVVKEMCESPDEHGRLVVTFAFLRQQEFVQKHSRVLFREGLTKGTGVVTKLNPKAPAPNLTRIRKPTL